MTTMNEERSGYMPIPTAEQVAEALANVRCFHDMSAELIAPDLLKNLLAAAPATPAAQVAVPDVSAMAKVLSDRVADACCVDPDDNWKIYGQEYIEDVRAMLAASTGQGEGGREGMRTHYYPNGLARYDSDGHDFVEQGPCGTWLGEASDLSGDWNRVDCKRCLKERPAITASSEAEERAIIAQMDDMAAHMQSAATAHPAERQEQGEVQMLREALEHCSEVMKDPWKHGEGCISRAINRAAAALAASTEGVKDE